MYQHWVERFLIDGSAFVPHNHEGVGDQLIVMLANGEKVQVRMKAQTFLEQVVRFFGSDLVALRKLYGQVIGRRYQVPLPLTAQFTLVPYKVRKPIGRQGAHGWFVAEQIRGLKRKSRVSTTIYLIGKYEITVLQSLESCEQQLRHVLLVQHHYAKLHRKPVTVREWSAFDGSDLLYDRGGLYRDR